MVHCSFIRVLHIMYVYERLTRWENSFCFRTKNIFRAYNLDAYAAARSCNSVRHKFELSVLCARVRLEYPYSGGTVENRTFLFRFVVIETIFEIACTK